MPWWNVFPIIFSVVRKTSHGNLILSTALLAIDLLLSASLPSLSPSSLQLSWQLGAFYCPATAIFIPQSYSWYTCRRPSGTYNITSSSEAWKFQHMEGLIEAILCLWIEKKASEVQPCKDCVQCDVMVTWK